MFCVSQQDISLSSPKGQAPAGSSVSFDLCLWTWLLRLLDHSFLASVVWTLVSKAGLETSEGFLVEGASLCLLVGRAGFWPSGGQGCVKGHV